MEKNTANETAFLFKKLPGSAPTPEKLVQEFAQVRLQKTSLYKPRTRHIDANGWAKYTNRLFLESSPYLLQHAHNPVNWYPWGAEAFAAAKALKRPVLLSVGYSTCHWCHVMEEESFEDEAIAQYMNENYIAIKVDREERPDVDAIYMSAIQALIGSGGWPMTVWLTDEQEPFYGGSYFPPRDGFRGSRPGFLTLLQHLKTTYDKDKSKVAAAAKEITAVVNNRLNSQNSGALPTARVWQQAIEHYKQRFDKTAGGVSGSPKFPSSMPVRLLLRDYKHTGDKDILQMATLTLKKMAEGGIYDHIAGGFHRYSTDSRWLVPHFEKMLYDNALLATIYLEAYQVTGDGDLAQTTREILDYVAADMTSAQGAFFSATDADSIGPDGEREEGYFFTWTPAEIANVLEPDESAVFQAYFNVTTNGNWEHRNILNLTRKRQEVAKQLKLNDEKFVSLIGSAKKKLYKARQKRPLPIRDEKILTSWNGLMISAFSRAGLVLGEQSYVDKASNAADFILANMVNDQKLSRSFKDGQISGQGYLDDYAFFTAGLIDLYEATSNLKWLKKAVELEAVLARDYEDKTFGGFFMTGVNQEKLIAREKPTYDGAEPSGNSVATLNLLRLGEFTGKEEYRARAEKSLQAVSPLLQSNPAALSEMLLAVDFYSSVNKEIVIVTGADQKMAAKPFLDEFRKQFVPNSVITVMTEGKMLEEHAQIIPWLKGKITQKGKATAYVCENKVCKLPTIEPKIFAKQI